MKLQDLKTFNEVAKELKKQAYIAFNYDTKEQSSGFKLVDANTNEIITVGTRNELYKTGPELGYEIIDCFYIEKHENGYYWLIDTAYDEMIEGYTKISLVKSYAKEHMMKVIKHPYKEKY